ncbi:UNVERIFIED_CONTAM: hypothetical protein FKN15_049916 [Acipenser sinensis]
MVIEDTMRNGRGLSDQWADTVVVRPRTTERHITVHKRLVLAFAISILTLIIVTVIAVLLSVKFEECNADSTASASHGNLTKFNQSRDALSNHRGEDSFQPWRQLRLPGSLRPLQYDLHITVFMDNFTFSGEVSIELQCLNSTKYVVLHADRLAVQKAVVYSEGKKTRALKIHRHFRYPANQVFVIAMHRELEPQKNYKVNITFQAHIEDELLGFFRSSYVLYGEKSTASASHGNLTKFNQSRDALSNHRGEDSFQPWRQLRLPGSLRPLQYDLHITVFMDNFTFSGEVSIELQCLYSTKYVVLHADRLAVQKAVVYSEGKKTRALKIHRHFRYPANQVFVIAMHRELEPQKNYKVNITFQAHIEDELLGFFRSSYVLYGEKRYLAVTQFSPTHARKAFPCLDEPIYKATFKISIKHESTYLSLSNMPVEASISEEDGWVTDYFSRTPRMSTYYLAWAVCNFTFKETVTDSGITIRLYARPDAIQRGSGDYALHITKRLLGFYEDYFKVKYSLPKLEQDSDLLSLAEVTEETFLYISEGIPGVHVVKLYVVQEKRFGAFSFWAKAEWMYSMDPRLTESVSSINAIFWFFQDSGHTQSTDGLVVMDQSTHSFKYSSYFVNTWFGDLVTPVWWEDVWLKEGFAHFFEFLGADFLFPDWHMEKQRFLTDVLHEVMLLDGLASSHPISQEVLKATDIDRVFDWIAYKKGAALIRMLANVMGQPVFQMGLNAMQKEGRDINIKEVMDLWTLQMGYPVVTITKNDSVDNSLTISQEHFIFDIKHSAPSNSSFQWQIPLTISVGNSSHISPESIIWVSNGSESHKIGSVDDGSWLLGNINQTGYFRVNYDLRNWRLLIEQLMRNPEVISVGNRAGLIDDVFNLARAGYLPQNIPLEIVRYLSQEKEFLPWHAASRVLYHLDKLLDRTEEYSIFSEYILKQVASMYHKLGWPTSAVNGSVAQATYQTEELRREVIMLACSFGSKHCHQQAITLISEWISSNKNRIPPNVRDIVYCTGVSLMDEDVWEFIWMKFHSSTAISEKKVLLEALACSDNTFLLNR